jgi:hypothetical protein
MSPWWIAAALVASHAIVGALCLWWGKLHPKQAAALLSDIDKAGAAIKKAG